MGKLANSPAKRIEGGPVKRTQGGSLARYEPIAEGIARLLHPFAEVVLHDVAKNRIVSIHNSLSKRDVGDSSLIEDLEGLREGPNVYGPFGKRTAPKRHIKYVSIKLSDERGTLAGLMCINLDLSVFAKIEQSMAAFLAVQEDASGLDSLFDDDWQERITAFVRKYLRRRSRSLQALSRGERAELVSELRDAGAFRAAHAPTFVANVLGVSRATIYNDLAASKTDAD